MKMWKRILAVGLSACSLFATACKKEEASETPTASDSSPKACEHEWEELKKEATCTKEGKFVKICEKCKAVEEEVIPAGHLLKEYRSQSTTCTMDGWAMMYCAREGCDYTTTKTFTKLGHSAGNDGYCMRDGCGVYVGTPEGNNPGNNPGSNPGGDTTLEAGFWADLKKNSVGGAQQIVDYTGDAKINGDPTAAEEYKGGAVTVTFYHTMSEALRNVLDAWIPEFNAMYPNITIDHKQIGGYDDVRTTITTELNGGNSPSIAYCYPDHVALYNKSRAVASLDNYIASTKTVTKADGTTEQMGFTQAEANEFVRAYYEEGRAYGDGVMYTLPYSKSSEVLYYNKTFFEENKLKVPTTWDEMEAVMQQIMAIDPKCVPLGYDSEGNWFITMCEQLDTPYTSAVDGQKFLFDVSTNQQFVGRLRDWYKNGLVTTEGIYGAYTSDLFTQTDPNEWKCYMTIGSSAGASHQCPDPDIDKNGQVTYPFEVGVAMPPQLDASNPKVISQGPSLCMFNKTNKQEMAATWLFMKFLTTNVGLQANFSTESGYAPVIKDLASKNATYAYRLLEADGNKNLKMTVIKQCLAQENAMFVSPAFVGSSGARDEVGMLIQNCLVNDTAGKSAADFINDQFKATISKLEYEFGK